MAKILHVHHPPPKAQRHTQANDHFTDAGNAERLVRRQGANMIYVPPWKKWGVWNGKRWSFETAGAQMVQWAKETARSILAAASRIADADTRRRAAAWALKSESLQRIRAMIELATAEPGVAVFPDQLDVNPWKLNCLNGVVDLREGWLADHRREDFITKLCPVEYRYERTCRTFERFLDRIFNGKKDLISYLQSALGYGATGSVREQVLFFLYGQGANGKSTLLNAVRETLGPDYASEAPPDLLMVKRDSHPTERAALFGQRFVTTVEVTEGRRMAEVLVKQLTGGEPIRARRMREDFWSFDPTHTIFLAANHRPEIRGTDLAIWRRIKLIPFSVIIAAEEQDRNLPEKLREEYEGILSWLVRGAVDWFKSGGLCDPADVTVATREYRLEMDLLGEFLGEMCVEGPDTWAKAADLLEAFRTWNGKAALSATAFGRRLAERGFTKDKLRGARIWRGIGLRA